MNPLGHGTGVSWSLSHCHIPRFLTPLPPGWPELRWAGAGCQAGHSRWTGWRGAGAPRDRRRHRPRRGRTAPAPRGLCHPELPASACKSSSAAQRDREHTAPTASAASGALFPLTEALQGLLSNTHYSLAGLLKKANAYISLHCGPSTLNRWKRTTVFSAGSYPSEQTFNDTPPTY